MNSTVADTTTTTTTNTPFPPLSPERAESLRTAIAEDVARFDKLIAVLTKERNEVPEMAERYISWEVSDISLMERMVESANTIYNNIAAYKGGI